MVAIASKDESERVAGDETVEFSGAFAPPDGLEVEAIEVRAYEIHLADSGAGALDNWLRAERELLEERQRGPLSTNGASEEADPLA